MFGVLLILAFGRDLAAASASAAFMFLLYIPLGYGTDLMLTTASAESSGRGAAMDVRMFTVGPVRENCYIIRRTARTAP